MVIIGSRLSIKNLFRKLLHRKRSLVHIHNSHGREIEVCSSDTDRKNEMFIIGSRLSTWCLNDSHYPTNANLKSEWL